MAKKKKKKKSTEVVPATTPKKPFNVKRAILIALSTIAAFVLYETLITIKFLPIGGVPIIMPIYFIITAARACAIIFLNSGFSHKEVTPDMLDGVAEPDEIEEICAKLNRRKKQAKKLMLVLLPFIFSILFDIVYLFYGDFFSGALSSIFGGQ